MHSSFKAIYKHVIQVLENQLPDYLTYHSVEHTRYVLDRVIYIASKEGVSKNDLFLLKVASLYHDMGFTKNHIDHEAIGCKIARNELPGFGLSDKEINLICGMIMATEIPQQPKTHLEEILADADLEYLGTRHFNVVSEYLYNEIKHFRPDLTRKEWNQIQVFFMENHQYHTKFCKRYKAFRKQKHIAELKNRL